MQRLAYSLHERWESLGPQALESIRNTEDIPLGAVSASVSLDGVMVALRAGEDGRAEACWREAACGTVSFLDGEGKRLKTLYLGRMPQSGKDALKAQLASEVAHICQARPDIAITAVARACPCEGGGSPRQLDLPGEPLTRGAGGRLLACLRASPHRLRPCGRPPLVRDIPPCPASRPPRRRQGDPGAALPPGQGKKEPRGARRHRARTCLLPQAPQAHALSRPQRTGLRHRIRPALAKAGVEAACKTLVTQRLKRSGMRWCIHGGQAVLTVRALIKSQRFARAWDALMHPSASPANDNSSTAIAFAPAA